MSTTDAVQVDASNAEQLRAWDGDEGAYWATEAEYFDQAIAGHDQRFVHACAISDGERVLDIGCGTGQTTRDAARAAMSGFALGVDLSSVMLAHARRRSVEEGIANARFEQVDAQIHPFDTAAFDVAISRTGAMFFGDPIVAFTNIARAVRPGGRLVLLTWQPLAHNEWIREFSGAFAAGRNLPTPPDTAPGPFSLSDPDRVRALLTGGGFTNIELARSTAGMWFGTDADDAHRFVFGLLGWMLDGLDDTRRDQARAALGATLTAHETDRGVIYDSAAWIIRASRP
jgi:SAM-dependent methyltransferase